MYMYALCVCVCTHLRPDTFSSMKLTTVLPNTKLENIVNRPAIAVLKDIAYAIRQRHETRGSC